MGEFRCNTISTCYLLTHSCHLDSCRLPAIDPYFLQSTHITDNPSSLSSLGSLTSGSHSDDSNFNNVSYDTSNDMSNFDPSLFNGLGFDFDESTGPTFDQNGLQQRQSSSFQPPPPTIPSFVLQHMHNNPNFLQQAQPYSQSSTAHVHPPPPPSYPTQQPNQPGTSSQIPFTFETQPPTPQQTSFQFAPSAFSFSQHPEPASSHHSTTTNPISSGPAKRKLSRISQDPLHQDPSSDTFATQSVESAAASKFVSIKPKPSTSSPKKKDSLEPPPPSSSSRTRPPPDHNAIERKYRDNIVRFPHFLFLVLSLYFLTPDQSHEADDPLSVCVVLRPTASPASETASPSSESSSNPQLPSPNPSTRPIPKRVSSTACCPRQSKGRRRCSARRGSTSSCCRGSGRG
jgi:hypothetical protein